jgi:hypothetical protein
MSNFLTSKGKDGLIYKAKEGFGLKWTFVRIMKSCSGILQKLFSGLGKLDLRFKGDRVRQLD